MLCCVVSCRAVLVLCCVLLCYVVSCCVVLCCVVSQDDVLCCVGSCRAVSYWVVYFRALQLCDACGDLLCCICFTLVAKRTSLISQPNTHFAVILKLKMY